MSIVALSHSVVTLDQMASLAERCQAEPDRHIAYVGTTADGIAAEIEEVEDWRDWVWVAMSDDGTLAAWLLAETETEIDRVWWWGPFVAAGVEWAPTADALYSAARAAGVDQFGQEEICGDDRHVDLAASAGAWGFSTEEASVALTLAALTPFETYGRTARSNDSAAIEALHAIEFVDTHLTPRGAAAVGDDERIRTVAEADGVVGAYAIAEVQPDGVGYIDFLASDRRLRGRGLGAAAIAAACNELGKRGCTSAALTVRENNTSARRLYSSLGFIEERLLRPYRKGFSLAAVDS